MKNKFVSFLCFRKIYVKISRSRNILNKGPQYLLIDYEVRNVFNIKYNITNQIIYL